jgi:hypothetical protein
MNRLLLFAAPTLPRGGMAMIGVGARLGGLINFSSSVDIRQFGSRWSGST